MSVVNATRFVILKRDNFTCQYCGRSSPEVVLEVDHIIPVSEGGKDDAENLITSCRECNRSKSGVHYGQLRQPQPIEIPTKIEQYRQTKLWGFLHDRIKMLAAKNGQSINEYLDQLTEGEEKNDL